jgi:hypothetical protein
MNNRLQRTVDFTVCLCVCLCVCCVVCWLCVCCVFAVEKLSFASLLGQSGYCIDRIAVASTDICVAPIRLDSCSLPIALLVCKFEDLFEAGIISNAFLKSFQTNNICYNLKTAFS